MMNCGMFQKNAGSLCLCCFRDFFWFYDFKIIFHHQLTLSTTPQPPPQSSLSPYLFDMILDVPRRGIKVQPHWCMTPMPFAYDIVICCCRRALVERKFEGWRRAMEERGLKISGKNTEYLVCNEHHDADKREKERERVREI